MGTRWNQFYREQMENEDMRKLVEAELENLRLGVQIAKLRERERMTQTELAARAEMSAPKISVIENRPKDLRVGTLIRLAHALNSGLEIRFLHKRRGRGRGRSAHPVAHLA